MGSAFRSTLRIKSAAGMKTLSRSLGRRVLYAKGKDTTSISPQRSCLALAPHPDDETLGCGVTIMRKRDAGTPVKVIVFTDGSASSRSAVLSRDQLAAIRKSEALSACTMLGLAEDDVVFLGYRDGHLEDFEDEVRARLAAFIGEFQPDELLVPSITDWHGDHIALARALRRLNKWPSGRVLQYSVYFWKIWPWVLRSRPRSDLSAAWHLVWQSLRASIVLRPELVSTEGYLARKRGAVAAYRSQLQNLTGEREWWTMDDAWLADFFHPFEMFVPLPDRAYSVEGIRTPQPMP
jgi:LmbE family N-acetylglucosaminyl deacetylase